MRTNKLDGMLNKLFTLIYNLALMNIYSLVLVFRGLIIFGVFPALVTLLRITKKTINGEKNILSWQLFKQFYKEEFKKSNIIGWIIVFIGLILYVNFKIIQSYNAEIPIFIIFAFYLVLLMYIIVVTWIFPLLANYYDSIRSYFANALVLGVTHLHLTALFVVGTFLIIYISLLFPGLFLFFTASILSFFWMYFTSKPLKKIQV